MPTLVSISLDRTEIMSNYNREIMSKYKYKTDQDSLNLGLAGSSVGLGLVVIFLQVIALIY